MRASQKGLDIFSGSGLVTGGQINVKKWHQFEFLWNVAVRLCIAINGSQIYLTSTEGTNIVDLLTPA